jgi:hypothetical protein
MICVGVVYAVRSPLGLDNVVIEKLVVCCMLYLVQVNVALNARQVTHWSHVGDKRVTSHKVWRNNYASQRHLLPDERDVLPSVQDAAAIGWPLLMR